MSHANNADHASLRAALTYTPNGATSWRHIWRRRRSELILWWWMRVTRLPGGARYLATYEHLIESLDQRAAHALGWHTTLCRGREWDDDCDRARAELAPLIPTHWYR